MDYTKYKNSRDLSWRVLIDNNVTKLPVKISDICRSLGIAVKYYVPEDDNDGFSTIINGKPIIFVSSLATRQRQRFTCAHELAHIIFGDVGEYELVNREPSPNDNPIEQRANVFASRVLAPIIVLNELNVQSPEDISRLCDISIVAARIRFERLQMIRERSERFRSEKGYVTFGMSPLERQVHKQFNSYIQENRL